MTTSRIHKGVNNFLIEGVVRTFHLSQNTGVSGLNFNNKLIVGGVDSTFERVNMLD